MKSQSATTTLFSVLVSLVSLKNDHRYAVIMKALQSVLAGCAFVDPNVASQLAAAVHQSPEVSRLRKQIAHLSPRLREVLALLAEGKSSKEIGAALFISPGTAKNHITKITNTLGVADRAKLVALLSRIEL